MPHNAWLFLPTLAYKDGLAWHWNNQVQEDETSPNAVYDLDQLKLLNKHSTSVEFLYTVTETSTHRNKDKNLKKIKKVCSDIMHFSSLICDCNWLYIGKTKIPYEKIKH